MPETLEARTLVTTSLALYGLLMAVFIVSENRRLQATLAWLLVLLAAPGFGLLVYLLFGRGRKAFSKQNVLLRQDGAGEVRAMLAPILARQDGAIRALEGGSESRRKLMTLVRRNSPSAFARAREVAILQDAHRFYPSLMDDVKAARRSVHLQFFTWRADPFTERLADLLAAKARDGVAVRVLYDPIGSPGVRRHMKALRASGVAAAPTSPPYRLHNVSYRNHRKICVIDGTIGYVGGMNMGQEHLDGGPGFASWRDTQVRLVGRAARVLQAVFLVDWANAVGERLFAAEPPAPGAPGEDDDGVPVQILTSGPDARWAAIRQLYAVMIASARRTVRLQSPFFIPDATIAEALATAAMAGVDVSLMVSARPSGNRLPDWAGRTFLADVVAAGVRAFLYKRGYLHAKTLAIDSETCTIGSANLDVRSFSIDYEVNAVLYDAELTRALEADFDRDLRDCSVFDARAYRRLGRALRFRDSLARLTAPLL